MAFGLDLSTLGNLGRAASKGIADNKAFNDEQRVLGGQEADRELSKLTLKAVMDPSPENQQALMTAIQSSKASPQTIARIAPVVQQIAQLPAKMEAERKQTEIAGLKRRIEDKGVHFTERAKNQRRIGELEGISPQARGEVQGSRALPSASLGIGGGQLVKDIGEEARRQPTPVDPNSVAANWKDTGDGTLTNVVTGATRGGPTPIKPTSGGDPARTKYESARTKAFEDLKKGDITPSQAIAQIERDLVDHYVYKEFKAKNTYR